MTRLPTAFARHLKPVRQNAMQARPPARGGIDEALQRAMEFRDRDELKQAERICVSVLTSDPDNVKALILAGSLAKMVEDWGLAIEFFKRAAAGEPGSSEIHTMLAVVYEKAFEYFAAAEHFRAALETAPDSIPAMLGLGRVYIGAGKIDLALAVFDKAMNLASDSATVRLDYANALTNVGRMEEAAGLLRANIAQNPQSIPSYFALAHTQKFEGEPPELSIVLDMLKDPGLGAGYKRDLHLTAGKILNDLGRYHEAVDHIQAGKLAVASDYDERDFRRMVDTLVAAFTPKLLKSKEDFGNPSEVPVFIVGMPRSGTSLVEQICASHPDVFGAGELTKFKSLVLSAGYTNKPDGKIRKHPQNLTAIEARSISGKYLEFLEDHAPGTSRIIDKLPHNFLNIGMIALLFPNARIIHCRRDPIDNCVSIFFQAFNETHAYGADLKNLGLYYREYDRLMRHWNTLLPGRIFECSYEALIADQEGSSRKLIDFLGLPWDDACLRYYEADRSVVTASLWQVRQPIYQTSIKRWKKYGSKVQPLIDALGDLATL